jgi:hypothetical protein
MMLKVLMYAYSTGTFSSRKIAQQIEESVPYRYLAAGAFPNHRTVCRFREQHLESFESLFVQVVHIAQEAGLVKMGVLAIDGSKVKANASKHKAMSYGRMQDASRGRSGNSRRRRRIGTSRMTRSTVRTSEAMSFLPSWPVERRACGRSRRRSGGWKSERPPRRAPSV